MAEKFTDIITYVLSLALAVGVIAFAAYKVVTLNGMENPPANLGLNFPAPKRKVIMEGPEGGDPLTTQSISPLPAASRRGGEDSNAPPYSYQLLTVVDGVAFVTVDTAEEKTLVPVTLGTKLPGGLTVESIRRRNGRWSLVAGNLTLDQAPPPLQ